MEKTKKLVTLLISLSIMTPSSSQAGNETTPEGPVIIHIPHRYVKDGEKPATLEYYDNEVKVDSKNLHKNVKIEFHQYCQLNDTKKLLSSKMMVFAIHMKKEIQYLQYAGPLLTRETPQQRSKKGLTYRLDPAVLFIPQAIEAKRIARNLYVIFLREFYGGQSIQRMYYQRGKRDFFGAVTNSYVSILYRLYNIYDRG